MLSISKLQYYMLHSFLCVRHMFLIKNQYRKISAIHQGCHNKCFICEPSIINNSTIDVCVCVCLIKVPIFPHIYLKIRRSAIVNREIDLVNWKKIRFEWFDQYLWNTPTLTSAAVSKFNSPNGPMVKAGPFCIQCIAGAIDLWWEMGSKYHGILYNSFVKFSF